jgi:predicted  nucleic acid-binding Zn-ribbon protein
MHDPITVSAGDISVEKVFVDDEFPVPAIKFVIRSESDETVDIRLTDSVPESFPMDCVGFHPDYDNDHWTAYQDHRVEFVRTLEPHQELTTVYGIRLAEADVDADAFLDVPFLDLQSTDESGGSEAEGVEDIVGADNNEVVRDVLSGESDTVPGMDDPADAYDEEFEEEPLADDDGSEPLAADPLAADESEPSFDEAGEVDGFEDEFDDDIDSDLGDVDDTDGETDAEEPLVLDDPVADDDAEAGSDEQFEPDESADEETDAEEPLVLDDPSEAETDEVEDVPEPRTVGDDTLSAVVERPEGAALHRRVDAAADEAEESEDGQADATHEGTATAAAGGLAAGGIAAALASEIREGNVDDDDLAVLKRELDVGVPNSVDVRIHRLQSQMDDLEAYSDALAEFIDEEGTGEQLIGEFRSEVSALSETVDALEAAVDGAEADRAEIRQEVEGVDAAVDDVEARVAATEKDLSTLSEEVDGLSGVTGDVDELAASVDSLDDEMGDVRADLADLDGDIVETREELEAEMDDLRADVGEDLRGDIDALRDDLEAVHSDIDELNEFRDRLASTFGGN